MSDSTAPPEAGAVDVPEAAQRRLRSGAFTSGLSVPDFAACLQMGMRPVGLVQGFAVMQWSFYMSGSPYLYGGSPYRAGGSTYSESYECPHGYGYGYGGGLGGYRTGPEDHRIWGQNFEQTWVEQTWGTGFGAAYTRMLEEAGELGAHGVVGCVDRAAPLTDSRIVEFHLTGTAVVIDGADKPPAPFTTYLSGQRLAKLIEAGFMPVTMVAAMTSVRMWAVCVTEYLMRGGGMGGGLLSSALGGGPMAGSVSNAGDEIRQLSDAHAAARRCARERARAQLGGDMLQGVSLEAAEYEVGEGDVEIQCILRGNRVRRFESFAPLDPPRPTVRLR